MGKQIKAGEKLPFFKYDTPYSAANSFRQLLAEHAPLVLVFMSNFGHPITRTFVGRYAATYDELTGGSLGSVLQALQELQSAGIPFKLNCVPLAENGLTDIMQLLKLAHKYQAPLRFIELMPLDCNADLKGLSGSEIRSQLEQAGLALQPDAQRYGNGPASYWRISGYAMPVGFIEPLHNKFCAVCNRVRLTSVGMLKPCLYCNEGMNLKRLLRDGASDADLLQAMQEIIYAKPAGHSFDVKAARFSMSQIGG